MDAPVFRSWNCPELKVEHPVKPFVGPGTIELRVDGSLNIAVGSKPFGDLDCPDHHEFRDVRITGRTDAGDEVVADHATSHRHTNKDAPTGSTMHFLAFQCEVRAPAYDATMVTKEVFHLKNTKLIGRGSFARGSSKVTICGPKETEFEAGRLSADVTFEHAGSAERISYSSVESLLRLAQRSLILAPCREEFSGDILTRTVAVPDTRKDLPRRPLVSWFGNRTALFVDATLTGYLSNVSLYDLDAMIQYYVFSYDDNVVQEIQFMFASVFMEGLKYNWARNVSTLHKDVKANGIIRGFKASSTDKKVLTFEDLMKKLAAHLGYNGTFTFVEDRHVIFHTGQSAAVQLGHNMPHIPLQAELFTLYDQMDDLLLRILGYDGVIYSPKDPNMPLSFPSRAPTRDDPLG